MSYSSQLLSFVPSYTLVSGMEQQTGGNRPKSIVSCVVFFVDFTTLLFNTSHFIPHCGAIATTTVLLSIDITCIYLWLVLYV